MGLSNDPEKRSKQLANLIPFDSENNPKPCGREKGIISYIKEKTNSLKDAIDLHVKVMRGEQIEGLKKPLSIFYRLDSAKWLFERCHGNRPLISEEDAEKYDLRAVLLVSLRGKTGEEYVDVGTAEQDLETQQSLQDPIQEPGGHSVQAQPPSD